MSKKTEVLRKQINETKAKIARLREAKAVKTTGVAYLIESELDKAQTILAARAISDSLQDMARKLAKVEADELMPLLDTMKTQFGPESAERFYTQVNNAIRGLLDSVKQAVDTITSETTGLETGTPPTDMARSEPDAPAPEAPAAAPPGDDLGDMGGDDMGDDLGGDLDDAGAEGDAEPEMDMAPPPTSDPAMGRERKESYDRGAALRESKNPDAMVLKSFVQTMKEGRTPHQAALIVAEQFDIDVSDVKDIVREGAKRPFDKAARKGRVVESMRNYVEMSFDAWRKAIDSEMRRRFHIGIADAGWSNDDALRYYKSSHEARESIGDFLDWYRDKYDLDEGNGFY